MPSHSTHLDFIYNVEDFNPPNKCVLDGHLYIFVIFLVITITIIIIKAFKVYLISYTLENRHYTYQTKCKKY